MKVITSVLQLTENIDQHKRLTRHVLLAMHDSRDSRCTRMVEQLKFPYPFADWSQEWHGVWWGDLILPAIHDVGPSLQAGRPSAVLAAFEAAVGPAVRSSHGVSMPSCPTIILQRRGHRLGEGGFERMPTSRTTDSAFSEWVWSHLEVPLRVRNEYPGAVRVNWIHGGQVKELMALKERETAERVVFLAHTLHAERLDRKGHTISEGSSLLIHTVVNESDMVIRPVSCLDLTSDCEDWTRKGECKNNERFMVTECPKSCNKCNQRNVASPKVQVRAAAKQGRAAFQARVATGPCADEYKDCKLWASMGECTANQEYMRKHCKLACGHCGDGACSDNSPTCAEWAKAGECTSNADFMATSCQKACGICGSTDDVCEDTHKKAGACKEWAKSGQCNKNKAFMEEKCRKSCGLCCKDKLPDCAGWKRDGHCTRNRRFMAKMCQRACEWCEHDDEASAGKDTCADEDIKCETWQKSGECTKNAKYMREECPKACGVCKLGARSVGRAAAAPPPRAPARAAKPITPPATPSTRDSDPKCEDHDPRCAAWASNGMCDQSRELMQRTCPKACGVCVHVANGKTNDPACGDTISSQDCASMKKTPDACSTLFMHKNCRSTCGLCGSARIAFDPRSGGQRSRTKEEL